MTSATRLLLMSITISAVAGCATHTIASSSPLLTARAGFPVYDGDVSIDPNARSIRAHWRIAFIRTADSVRFLLNDSLIVTRVDGPDVLSHTEQREPGQQVVTVRFGRREATDRLTVVDIDYAGVPAFSDDSINGIRPDWVELGLDSFWHPVFDDFAQRIVARVRLQLPPAWEVAASGSLNRDNDDRILVNDVPLIDVALTSSPTLRHTDTERVSVYHVGADPAVVARVLETTSSCAAYLDARYGAHGLLPHVKLVLAPRGGPGYARKNYVVITRGADLAPVPLQRFVCHELAHYWSTGAISSGPDNWLNEAFAEFVAARYVHSASGDSAYAAIVAQWRARGEGQPPIWTAGSTKRPTARAAYSKAPYLLYRLEERVGTPMMDRILTRFMLEPLRTTPAVIDMVSDVAGAETATWLTAQLAS